MLDGNREKETSLISNSDDADKGDTESETENLPSGRVHATVTFQNPPAHPIIDLMAEPEPKIGKQMRKALQEPYISPSESDESLNPNDPKAMKNKYSEERQQKLSKSTIRKNE
jgi:hypothetical protein